MASVHAEQVATPETPATEVAQVPSTLAVLKAAEAWLSDPKRWTTGAFSRDAEGRSLGCEACVSGQPASTCGEGALMLAAGTHRVERFASPVEAELGECIPLVNDGEVDGYQRIMAAYRRAITKLEQAA